MKTEENDTMLEAFDAVARLKTVTANQKSYKNTLTVSSLFFIICAIAFVKHFEWSSFFTIFSGFWTLFFLYLIVMSSIGYVVAERYLDDWKCTEKEEDAAE